jgi:hypothetical protein
MSHSDPASDLIPPDRALSVAAAAEQLIALAVDSVDSPRSKRAYRQALEEFLA